MRAPGGGKASHQSLAFRRDCTSSSVRPGWCLSNSVTIIGAAASAVMPAVGAAGAGWVSGGLMAGRWRAGFAQASGCRSRRVAGVTAP